MPLIYAGLDARGNAGGRPKKRWLMVGLAQRMRIAPTSYPAASSSAWPLPAPW